MNPRASSGQKIPQQAAGYYTFRLRRDCSTKLFAVLRLQKASLTNKTFMIADKINTKELFSSLDDTTSEFLRSVSLFDENEINKISFEDSWTAAQIAEHVTRSNIGITKELQKEGKTCDREPDAGVQGLRSVFLNFTTKLKSPEFILPTKNVYKKERLIADLKKSIDRLKEEGKQQDLFKEIHHPIFGDVTKLELLHFVVYHTQRHIHQLKNILKIIKEEKRKPG